LDLELKLERKKNPPVILENGIGSGKNKVNKVKTNKEKNISLTYTISH